MFLMFKQNAPVRIILLFKDQRSTDVVRRQLSDLGKKINSDLTLVKNGQKSPTRIAEMQELFIKEYNEMEFGMDIV